jgi:hypothetical protein
MRRMMTALACFALVAGSWSTALAQDAEYGAAEYEGPMFSQIMEFDVSPADAAGFEMAMEKIVEAAKLADLSADYGWMFFRTGSTFTLVYPVESMAYFDDEDQWMRQFMGTPGEATLMEAFESFGELDYSSKSSINKFNPAHSYDPPNPIENTNQVMVYVNLVKPGKQEAHAENTAELIKIISDVQWRYAVHAYDGVIGNGGLRIYVVPFDDLSTFHGEGSLPAALAQHEKGEEWEALMGKRMKLVRATDSQDHTFVPDMTYMPEEN